MKYSDMHCDTLSELFSGGFKFEDAPLHINLSSASCLSPYMQVAAVWTDKRLTDTEAYDRFIKITDSFKSDKAVSGGRVMLCKTEADLRLAESSGIPAFVLSVEGARMLCGDMEKFDAIVERGVRLITLEWKGSDCVGGAWDTDEPLTAFGRRLISRMAERGISADISHSNDIVANEVLDSAEKNGLIVCASHSNSRSVCGHMRNLTDDLFLRIQKLDGVVGLSMAPAHLSENGTADRSDICRHLYRYLELGGEDTVCFGCDFDGVDSLPDGITGISDMPDLREFLMKNGFSEKILDKLFYENAERFIKKILKCGPVRP